VKAVPKLKNNYVNITRSDSSFHQPGHGYLGVKTS
jgi:hypothetical protein